MCRLALETPEGRAMARAFQSGILLLLAAPVITFATVAWLAIRSRRRLSPIERTAAGPVPDA
jgi:hypothetical protein